MVLIGTVQILAQEATCVKDMVTSTLHIIAGEWLQDVLTLLPLKQYVWGIIAESLSSLSGFFIPNLHLSLSPGLSSHYGSLVSLLVYHLCLGHGSLSRPCVSLCCSFTIWAYLGLYHGPSLSHFISSCFFLSLHLCIYFSLFICLSLSTDHSVSHSLCYLALTVTAELAQIIVTVVFVIQLVCIFPSRYY